MTLTPIQYSVEFVPIFSFDAKKVYVKGQVQAKLTHLSVFKMSFGASTWLALIDSINVYFFIVVYFVLFIESKNFVRLLVVVHLVFVFLICKN
jgi:hypothetical protein